MEFAQDGISGGLNLLLGVCLFADFVPHSSVVLEQNEWQWRLILDKESGKVLVC